MVPNNPELHNGLRRRREFFETMPHSLRRNPDAPPPRYAGQDLRLTAKIRPTKHGGRTGVSALGFRQCHQHRLLRVQAVFRLLENGVRVQFEDFLADLLATVGRQAVKDDMAGYGV